jgi:hypothetical protein
MALQLNASEAIHRAFLLLHVVQNFDLEVRQFWQQAASLRATEEELRTAPKPKSVGRLRIVLSSMRLALGVATLPRLELENDVGSTAPVRHPNDT